MRAPREELQELHGMMVSIFRTYLTQPNKSKIRASMLEVIRGFLKDNGVFKHLERTKDIQGALQDLGGLDIPFVLPDLD